MNIFNPSSVQGGKWIVGVNRVQMCEGELRRALQVVQSTADLSEVADLYEGAKRTVMSALQELEGRERNEAGRGVVSLLLYLHLAYRTKEADRRQLPRLLAVR